MVIPILYANTAVRAMVNFPFQFILENIAYLTVFYPFFLAFDLVLFLPAHLFKLLISDFYFLFSDILFVLRRKMLPVIFVKYLFGDPAVPSVDFHDDQEVSGYQNE